MISIAFFNTNDGVGKSPITYHTAWMFAELGYRMLAVDLDPQSNVSIMALGQDRLEEFWLDGHHPKTLAGTLEPLFGGSGSINPAHIEPLTDRLGLLVGDLALSKFEDDLSISWPSCLDGDQRSFRVTTAFWRVLREAAREHAADLVLIDVGPNLGAINRAALVASSHVVVPVAPDLFSLQGLKNLGPTLRQWRSSWAEALRKADSSKDLPKDIKGPGNLPAGSMTPVGYVLMQHSERRSRPTKAYGMWIPRLGCAYRESVLDQAAGGCDGGDDKNQICRIKHYRSLMPMAMEAGKPMFSLTPADGAIGAHQANVQQCRTDFASLAEEIARRVDAPSSLYPF